MLKMRLKSLSLMLTEQEIEIELCAENDMMNHLIINQVRTFFSDSLSCTIFDNF